MKKVVYIFLAALFLALTVSGCTGLFSQESEQTSGQTSEQTSANIDVYLTDRPLTDIDKLYVDISDINFKYEYGDESTTVTLDVATQVDLLSLAGTESHFFTMKGIPDGATLVYIQLKVNDATVVYNDKDFSVDIPNGQVKILVNQKVSSDTELVLDFDAAQSVRCNISPTNPTNPIQCKLIPVISHAFRNKESARIKGEVRDSNGVEVDFALVVLFEGESPIRATLTNKWGKFFMGGIKPGSYELKVYTDYNAPSYEDSSEKDINDLISGYTPATSTEVALENGKTLELELKVE